MRLMEVAANIELDQLRAQNDALRALILGMLHGDENAIAHARRLVDHWFPELGGYADCSVHERSD